MRTFDPFLPASHWHSFLPSKIEPGTKILKDRLFEKNTTKLERNVPILSHGHDLP
jgi:hypothetical protein